MGAYIWLLDKPVKADFGKTIGTIGSNECTKNVVPGQSRQFKLDCADLPKRVATLKAPSPSARLEHHRQGTSRTALGQEEMEQGEEMPNGIG